MKHIYLLVLLVIFLNIGVMLGPSVADLKTIWPLIAASFFINSEGLAQVLALVIAMIIVNIILFLVILLLKKLLTKKNRPVGRLDFPRD